MTSRSTVNNVARVYKIDSGHVSYVRQTFPLGEFEQLVLLAVLRLEEDATGTRIARELEGRAARNVSRSALYTTLDRLEKKGFLHWVVRSSTSTDRQRQPVRRFTVTEEGLEAIREAHEAWVGLTNGIEDLLRRRTS